MRRLLILLLLVLGALGAVWLPARAQTPDFVFSVDEPTRLAGSDYLAYETVRWNGAYALSVSPALPPDVNINALDAYGSDFLFSADAPFKVGATTYLPRDVVRYSGGVFSLFWQGSSAGLPLEANIDALANLGGGRMIMSFDAPVTVLGVTFEPCDLALVNGTAFSMYFDGSAVALPPETNITGAEIVQTATTPYFYLNFDEPIVIGGTAYLPNDIVQWRSGVGFSLYWSGMLNGFPPAGAMTDFYFTYGSPGEVPWKDSGPVTAVRVTKSGANLSLTWSASCLAGATGYAVYEGNLGSYYSHNTQKVCPPTAGLSASFAIPSGNKYYLVVPDNAAYEGSYGKDSSGYQRPKSGSVCNGLASRIDPCP